MTASQPTQHHFMKQETAEIKYYPHETSKYGCYPKKNDESCSNRTLAKRFIPNYRDETVTCKMRYM